MMEELSTGTSQEVAHSLPRKDRPSPFPAPYALTPVRGTRSGTCGREAWHATGLRQTLIVTAGCGRVQRWVGPIEDIRPGDVIWFPPGETIGTAPRQSQPWPSIALQEQLDGKVVDWMEQVSSEHDQGW